MSQHEAFRATAPNGATCAINLHGGGHAQNMNEEQYRAYKRARLAVANGRISIEQAKQQLEAAGFTAEWLR